VAITEGTGASDISTTEANSGGISLDLPAPDFSEGVTDFVTLANPQ
jgi:hypothetical protein